MATVKKQGTGYKITVSMGYDIHGKQIRQHMTWTPSPGMTPKQVEKELKRQEVLFEESCKARQSLAAASNWPTLPSCGSAIMRKSN